MQRSSPSVPFGRAIALGAVFALASVAFAGCTTTRRTDASRQLVVGASALRISLPVFVAAQERIFARHGLDVSVRTYNTAQPMMDDVALGHIDAGGYVAYPIAFLAARRAARPTRLVTELVEDSDHRLSYVLARSGAGLHFPADARGKRIGILPTVAYRRWLVALLRTAGIGENDVTIVPIEPALEIQALRDGGVDMLFTNDPMATAIVANHVGEIVDDGPPCARRLADPFGFGTFAISGELAEGSPDRARDLIAALDEAIARVRADPIAARRAMANFIRPEERPFVDRYPPSRYLDSREATAPALDTEIARARSFGILDAAPHVQAWLALGAR